MGVSVAGSPCRGAQKRRRRIKRDLRSAAALIASALFHAVILILLFGSLKGGPVTGGGASGASDSEVHAITISLAGLRAAPRQPANPSDAMQALFAKIRSEQSTLTATDTPVPLKGDAARLFDVVAPGSKTNDTGNGGVGRGEVDQGGQGADAGSEAKTQAEKSAKGKGLQNVAGPGSDASAGKLWLQIKPCWSQLPNVSSVPVTLEISLNDQGRIAVPPKIMRESTNSPDQARLIAEARALTAVTACVPYHPAAVAGATRLFRVEFGTSPPSAARKG